MAKPKQHGTLCMTQGMTQCSSGQTTEYGYISEEAANCLPAKKTRAKIHSSPGMLSRFQVNGKAANSL
jgi:hypothetical protein